MKKVIVSLLALFVLFCFMACDFFTTSWGEPLKRDLETLLKEESTQDLAKLADNPNYKGDSAAALLNALSDAPQEEIQNLTTEEKENILELSLIASFPIETISLLTQGMNDNMDAQDFINSIINGISEFDTTVIQTILSKPEDLSSESLISASTAIIAQVLKREGSGMTLENLFTEVENTEDENKDISFRTLDLDPQSKAELEVIYSVYTVFQPGGARAGEEISLLGITLSDLLGGN